MGGSATPLFDPPLNQKFAATPKICLKFGSSSKTVDFTIFFLKFLAAQAKAKKSSILKVELIS